MCPTSNKAFVEGADERTHQLSDWRTCRSDGTGRRNNFMAFTVTKDTIIGDVLDYDSSLAEIFFGIGMHCVG